jgi:heme-degrading monooxygenase HmoA
MIESHFTWDLVPGVDAKAYGTWAKNAIGVTVKAPGLVEFRANRNLAGNPQVLVVSVWESLTDWAHFAETSWAELEGELRSYATDIHYTLWATSPLVPQPLRPAK